MEQFAARLAKGRRSEVAARLDYGNCQPAGVRECRLLDLMPRWRIGRPMNRSFFLQHYMAKSECPQDQDQPPGSKGTHDLLGSWP